MYRRPHIEEDEYETTGTGGERQDIVKGLRGHNHLWNNTALRITIYSRIIIRLFRPNTPSHGIKSIRIAYVFRAIKTIVVSRAHLAQHEDGEIQEDFVLATEQSHTILTVLQGKGDLPAVSCR